MKWPNDIFFGSKKLIGFLPRVIIRGKEIIYVRIGLGMNVLNYTPSEGISLSKVLQTKNILIIIIGQPKFLKLLMMQLNVIRKKNM